MSLHSSLSTPQWLHPLTWMLHFRVGEFFGLWIANPVRSKFAVAVQSAHQFLEFIAALFCSQTFVPILSFHQRIIHTASDNMDVLFSRHLFFTLNSLRQLCCLYFLLRLLPLLGYVSLFWHPFAIFSTRTRLFFHLFMLQGHGSLADLLWRSY